MLWRRSRKCYDLVSKGGGVPFGDGETGGNSKRREDALFDAARMTVLGKRKRQDWP